MRRSVVLVLASIVGCTVAADGGNPLGHAPGPGFPPPSDTAATSDDVGSTSAPTGSGPPDTTGDAVSTTDPGPVGPADGEAYSRCLETVDCADGLECVPGYDFCSVACDEDGQCPSPLGGNIVPRCDYGYCQLYCDAAGSTCPGGMDCADFVCLWP